MVNLSEAGKKALDALVAETQAQRKIPGFVIAVSNRDEQIYASGGGNLVFDDPTSAPVSAEDTVFWICSMTKLVVGLAGLQLVEQSKLNLEDPVTKYIPQFKDAVVIEGLMTPNATSRPAKGVPTVGSLFDHSNGTSYFARMPDPIWGLSEGYTFDYSDLTRYEAQERYIELLKEGWPGIPLAFEPGTAFSYGLGFDVLGIVIERVTGQSLSAYCDEHIFKPLGITSTFQLTADMNERLLGLNFRDPRDGNISAWNDRAALTQRYPSEVNRELGGIGMYSTLPDYLTLLRHLLRIEDGQDVPSPILSQDTVKSLFKPRHSPLGEGAMIQFMQFISNDPNHASHLNHGLGVGIVTKDWDGERRAGSGFWSGWAGTNFMLDPTTGIAIVSGTQVVPSMDAGATELFRSLEKIVYANMLD